MPNLRKVEDTASRIRYAHSHASGWVVAAVGLAGLWYTLTSLDGAARIGVLVLAGLFTASGISSALSRFELTLDFDRRRVRYRKGSLLNPERGDEPFDVVERVVLKKDFDRKGGRDVVDEWEVKIELTGWPRPIELFESNEERPAREEAERLAGRLGVALGER